MFEKFKKALRRDKENFELSSHLDDDENLISTFKIPQDYDVEKRNTTIIERLIQSDHINRNLRHSI